MRKRGNVPERDETREILYKTYDDGVSEVFNRIIQARNHLIRKHLSDKYKHFVRLRFPSVFIVHSFSVDPIRSGPTRTVETEHR